MTTIRHCFLDLEDTLVTPIVNGWADFNIINQRKVLNFIANFQPDQVHLFSFAVWNQHELSEFNLRCRPTVERLFKIKFDSTPTVDDDIIPACCSVMGISSSTVDFSDASAFWSKHEAFRLFVRNRFKNSWTTRQQENEVVLLDDVVINETFEWPDLHIKGRLLNIDTMT